MANPDGRPWWDRPAEGLISSEITEEADPYYKSPAEMEQEKVAQHAIDAAMSMIQRGDPKQWAEPTPEKRAFLAPLMIEKGFHDPSPAVPEILHGPYKAFSEMYELLAKGAQPSDPEVVKRSTQVAGALTGMSGGSGEAVSVGSGIGGKIISKLLGKKPKETLESLGIDKDFQKGVKDLGLDVHLGVDNEILLTGKGAIDGSSTHQSINFGKDTAALEDHLVKLEMGEKIVNAESPTKSVGPQAPGTPSEGYIGGQHMKGFSSKDSNILAQFDSKEEALKAYDTMAKAKGIDKHFKNIADYEKFIDKEVFPLTDAYEKPTGKWSAYNTFENMGPKGSEAVVGGPLFGGKEGDVLKYFSTEAEAKDAAYAVKGVALPSSKPEKWVVMKKGNFLLEDAVPSYGNIKWHQKIEVNNIAMSWHDFITANKDHPEIVDLVKTAHSTGVGKIMYGGGAVPEITIYVPVSKKPPAGSIGKGVKSEHLPTEMEMSRWPDAKVIDRISVDEAHPGPIIAYHGTRADNFINFDLSKSSDIGVHFGTKEQAGNRAYPGESNPTSRIIPAHIDVKNPIELPDLGGWHPEKMARAIQDQLGVGNDRGLYDRVHDMLLKNPYSDKTTKKAYQTIRNTLGQMGYDSIRYQNTVEGEGWSYIVWKKGQVKSATNPDHILYAGGPGPPPKDRYAEEPKDVEDRREEEKPWWWSLPFAIDIANEMGRSERRRKAAEPDPKHPYDPEGPLAGPRPEHGRIDYSKEKLDKPRDRDSADRAASREDRELANQLRIIQRGYINWLNKHSGAPLEPAEEEALNKRRLPGGAGNAPY